jgi:hypothetical protein
MALPPVDWPDSSDPLELFTRDKQPLGHVLRGLWRPLPAFLVGAGPSLNNLDLGFLRRRGVCSLGINNAAAVAPVCAMTFSDPPEKFHHSIFLDAKILKFAPRRKLGKRVRAKVGNEFRYTRFRVQDCPSTFGVNTQGMFEPERFFETGYASTGTNDSGRKQTGRPKVIFTFFMGLRLLHYLGVPRVYLIGVDFSMSLRGQYAYGDEHPADFVDGNNGHYHVARSMLRELRPVCDRVGLEVYNCNPRSCLDAFPYVPYEDAVADCSQWFPDEPLDCSGYYDKSIKEGTCRT